MFSHVRLSTFCLPCGVHQLEHLADRFAGRILEPVAAPAAFVRVRPDGQKFTKEEDESEEGEGTPGVGAGAAAGSG